MKGALSSAFSSFPFLLFISSSLSLFYSLTPFSSSLLFLICLLLRSFIFLPSFLFPSFPFLFLLFPLLPYLFPLFSRSSTALRREHNFSLSLSSYPIFFSFHDSSLLTPSSLLLTIISSPHNSFPPSSPLYTSPIVIARTIATKIVTTHSRTIQNRFISPETSRQIKEKKNVKKWANNMEWICLMTVRMRNNKMKNRLIVNLFIHMLKTQLEMRRRLINLLQ
jgi:hypothetical protein